MLWIPVYGSIEDHFSACIDKPPQLNQQIEGIDYIYLINLDKRPQRLATSLKELNRYKISPYRFSAIDGKNLSRKALKESCFIYQKEMESNRWARLVEDDGQLSYLFLNEDAAELPIFSEWMTPGAVGCALSHLSILQDAYNSGYDTILVLEDDIKIKKDPHLISALIKKLDLFTHEDWDILYIDPTGLEIEPNNSWFMWRPDHKLYETQNFVHRQKISKDFFSVASHTRTHSMIIRRSGMEKILNHLKNNGLYLPIDHEIAFANEINLYVTSEIFITYAESLSDIKSETPYVPDFSHTQWDIYKSKQLANLTLFNGWCKLEKANHLMNFFYQHKPLLSVEIGTFGGSTTFPILSALEYLKQGHLLTIDAWDNQKAIEGFEPTDPNYIWWKALDLNQIYQKFIYSITKMKLTDHCTVIRSSSQEAAKSFADESIDLVYIDGNFSPSGSLDDVKTYFPKVKPGGYIWLNNGSSPEKLPSVVYLMEHAFWLKEESLENRCLVFQKSNSK